MKENLRISLTIVCGLLVWGVSARADQDEGSCSNKSLKGSYGFSVEGLVLPAPGIAIPIRGVHMTRFDGLGNLTQVDHIVINGIAPPAEWSPAIGTYHVNADCTGTMQILPTAGGFVNLKIVVINKGNEVRAVVTAPYDGPPRTVTSAGVKN